ncbi:MAG: hypothetical protein PVF22_02625 [Candidatus Aminicenantes bacterium]|jgi:outer membrane lipoprotein-sorting protein
MKKSLTFGLLGLFLFLCFSTLSGFSQDAKGLLNKIIEASGGREALAAIKDTTVSGSMEMIQMGVSGSIYFYHKEPNKLRTDIEVMGTVITSAFDGEVGWMVDPTTGAKQELPADALEDAKNEALGFGFVWLIHPEKFGITSVDKGKETVEDKEYIVLEQTFDNGKTSIYYIDPGTYLPYRMVTTTTNQYGIEVEQETLLTDYKKADGIMFAHTITILQDGEEFGTMTVDEVKFNTGLEDSLFKME